MLLLQNDSGIYNVIYVAAIGGVFSVVLAILAYYFGIRKNTAEIEGLKKKNAEQDLKNAETGNTALDKATDFIDELGKKVIELQGEKQTLKQEKEIEKTLKNQAEGRAKAAFEDRDKFLERLRIVESEVIDLKKDRDDYKQKYEQLLIEVSKLKDEVEAIKN